MSNDHFIAQGYLRQWEIPANRKWVYSFDKALYRERKIHPSGVKTWFSDKGQPIKKIVSAHDYYNWNGEKSASPDEMTTDERLMDKFETPHRQWLGKLEKEVAVRNVGKDTQVFFSEFAAVQFKRTDAYREFLVGAYGGLSDDEIKRFHGRHIFEESEAKWFNSLSWAFGINRTANCLYTSDMPLVSQNSGLQFRDKILEGDLFSLPLTPRMVLLIYTHASDAKHDPFLELSEGSVSLLNRLQIGQSRQYVFSRDRHCEECERFCDSHPDVMDQDRFSRDGRRLMEQAGLGNKPR